jgi:ribokinase
MIGRVGDDVFGGALCESLRGDGVDIGGVVVSVGPSGVAVIAVDDGAENTIVVAPGANGAIGPDDLARLERALDGARVLLLQLEVPLAAVQAAAHAAHRRGVTVILDPAPAQPLPAELYTVIDILTPNESEAGALVGFPVHDAPTAARAAAALRGRGVPAVIVKLGEQGAYWAEGAGERFCPAFRVEPVDTVAAGDAFNGALAAALSERRPLAEALRWGLAAGALSTTRAGAQPSMPDREAVLALLEHS